MLGVDRQRLLELEAKASSNLTKELSRFPERPRGRKPGRTEALRMADEAIAERKQAGALTHEAMQTAVARVRHLANDHSYETPERQRLQSHGGAWFASDVVDVEEVRAIARRVAEEAGVGRKGVGKRTNHQALAEMVRALMAMQQMGVPLPAPTIRIEHLACEAFATVLEREGFLLRAGITGEQVEKGEVTPSELRNLSEAARHRLLSALPLFSAGPGLLLTPTEN